MHILKLYLTVAKRRIRTNIVSVNPQLLAEKSRQEEKRKNEEHFKGLSQYEMASIQRIHDSTAISAIAHQLPFKDASFDLILDNNAVSLYMKEEEKEVFKITIQEELRILKPGGRIRIGDPIKMEQWTDPTSFKRRALEELGLNYLLLRGRLVQKDGTNWVFGAEITK